MASLEILASIITLIYWYLVFFRSLGSRSNSNCISNYPLGLFKVLPGNVITLGSCDVLYNFIFCEYSCIIFLQNICFWTTPARPLLSTKPAPLSSQLSQLMIHLSHRSLPCGDNYIDAYLPLTWSCTVDGIITTTPTLAPPASTLAATALFITCLECPTTLTAYFPHQQHIDAGVSD